LKVLLTKIAQRDIDKAAEWYERQREGLGFTFLDRVDQGLDKIALNPTGYRKVFGENRRCTLEQFPYALWFKVENDVIVEVLANRVPAREAFGGWIWDGAD
jgi:plasmid stabilization system protein ParE